jgi:hypothetical protein
MAALPPLSTDQLVNDSSDVVVAEVMKVKTWTERVKYGRDEFSVAMVKIATVEKGKLQPGVLIEVHYRQTGSRAEGWAGPQGQNSPLPEGEKVRLYLLKQEGVYRLLEPNGWTTP